MLQKITTLVFIFTLLFSQVCCYVHAHLDHEGNAVGSSTSHVHLIWDAGSKGHDHGSHGHSHTKKPQPNTDSQQENRGMAFDVLDDGGHAVSGRVAILVRPSSWNDSSVSPGQVLDFCGTLPPKVDLSGFPVRPQVGKLFAVTAALYLHHCRLRL